MKSNCLRCTCAHKVQAWGASSKQSLSGPFSYLESRFDCRATACKAALPRATSVTPLATAVTSTNDKHDAKVLFRRLRCLLKSQLNHVCPKCPVHRYKHCCDPRIQHNSKHA